jgi:acetolactate synthase regulatory subunit
MQLTALPQSPQQAAVARRLELATTGEQDVLPRALGWLRRRGCSFTRVEYRASDRHGPERFVVAVHVPHRHADRLARGLENLVGVTTVRVE